MQKNIYTKAIDRAKLAKYKAKIQKLSEYTITNIIDKKSGSNTIVCQVTNSSTKLYFKIGLIDTSIKNNIDYELYVYKKLFLKIVDEPEIPKYFMDYDREISGIFIINDFLDNIKITDNLKKKFKYELIKNYKQYNISINSRIVIVATYDTDAVKLNDYLNKFDDSFINIENEKSIFIKFITIILLISNAIKILDHLNINHNDMHYQNILIKEEKTQYIVNIYDKKSNILNSDIKIIIYDFDRAYMDDRTSTSTSTIKNKRLDTVCIDGQGCNEFLSNRNYFFLIQTLYLLYFNFNNKGNYTKLLLFFRNLLKRIIPNDEHFTYYLNMFYILLYDPYNQITNNKIFWSASCILVDDTNIKKIRFDCDKKLNSSFNWVQQIPELLNEYILELDNTKKLSIIETSTEINFQKKYLKYKYKYKKYLMQY